MIREVHMLKFTLTTIVAFTSLWGVSVMAIEKPEYRLLDTIGDVQIREYKPFIIARTRVESTMERAGNEGFRRLAGYIFGGNESGEKIAMTAPVAQSPVPEASDDGQAWWLTFMMPGKYSLETLPRPQDPRVELVSTGSSLMAVLPYRGSWSVARYQTHEARLRAVVDEMPDWHASGEPVWSRYDPPMMPWFMRRNEVAIPIAGPDQLNGQ